MQIKSPNTSHIPAMRALWKEAFGDTDDFLDNFYKTAYSPKHSRIITLYNKVVAALYWFDCSYNNMPIAYIYAVATATTARGQGYCHKLMETTHKHLKMQGYAGAILVPGDASLVKLYENMGYNISTHIDIIHCNGKPTDIELHLIDKDEYARRRRSLLPEGSVLQEHENLDFLETQVSFYAGDNILLAARINDDTLLGAELLGNTSFAPYIVNSLGCSTGVFRSPGHENPFAMYLPLLDNSSNFAPPSYFSFAFD